MFNVKQDGGTFKGIIGECMFKLTDKNVVITKFFNKKKYFSIFERHLTNEQYDFLDEYWYSIDAIDIVYNGNNKRIFLYEIKTRNKYHKDLHFKPKMTYETHIIYNNSKSVGFIPKLVTVWMLDNWEYTVEIVDFDEKEYSIDKPKNYDRRL